MVSLSNHALSLPKGMNGASGVPGIPPFDRLRANGVVNDYCSRARATVRSQAESAIAARMCAVTSPVQKP